MCEDDGNIREIKSRCRDIEDRDDRLRGANADEIEADTGEDDEPDSVDGGAGVGAYLAPETGFATYQDRFHCGIPSRKEMGGTYPENGKASSRAKAYAILVSASMAEQPVKN